jgi:HK97 gp10 family phage protein
MPEVVSVNVRGLDELEAKLAQMAPKIGRSVIRRGLKAGAQVFLEEMQARAARLTGFLREHIGMKIKMRAEDLAGTAMVGPLKVDYPQRQGKRGKGSTISAASVARFLEFGTSKMRARPFIRQSFEVKKGAALDAFVSEAKAGYEDAVK